VCSSDLQTLPACGDASSIRCCYILHPLRIKTQAKSAPCVALGVGTVNAATICMKVTQTILREIAFQISDGNPLWGLLLANEYLYPDDLLHRALVSQARRRFGSASLRTKLILGIMNGERACSLSSTCLARVGSRVVRSNCPTIRPRAQIFPNLAAPIGLASRRPASRALPPNHRNFVTVRRHPRGLPPLRSSLRPHLLGQQALRTIARVK